MIGRSTIRWNQRWLRPISKSLHLLELVLLVVAYSKSNLVYAWIAMLIHGGLFVVRGMGIDADQWTEDERNDPAMADVVVNAGNPAHIRWGLLLIVIAVSGWASGIQIAELMNLLGLKN
jgi:hypothetical protein